jgi:hypothetical protein
MRYLLVAVKDNAVEAFQPVASVRARGEAIRSFQDAINNPQNIQLNSHPEDFDLYYIGDFDDQTGRITDDYDGGRLPVRLARGADYKTPKKD